MKYNINPEDAPKEIVDKVKRLIKKDKLEGGYLELRFNKRFDSVKIIDIYEKKIITVYDLNYKETQGETSGPGETGDRPVNDQS